MAETIQGSTVITKTNYERTHGCANFREYVTGFSAKFIERRDSGVYVIAASRSAVSGIAAFAGYNAAHIGKVNGNDAWIVQRAQNIVIIDATC